VGAEVDLPWERTEERNNYRKSMITLERAVRTQQEMEDQIKQGVRLSLRNLRSAIESFKIQGEALYLATRRVESTQVFLQAGRAQMRDVLDAQDSLVSAQNAANAALVNCRVAELQLQRDMEVLDMDEEGLWREYKPENNP
jgi:outer membrane protein TolC